MYPDRDGVITLSTLEVARSALGSSCWIQAVAERSDQLEDAVDLIADLDLAWGPGGDLDQLRAAVPGEDVPISWETVLLLGRTDDPHLQLDVREHRVRRTGAVRLPDLDARHALAAELITCELIDSGCLAARVRVGAFQSSANRGIRADFADRPTALRRPPCPVEGSIGEAEECADRRSS